MPVVTLADVVVTPLDVAACLRAVQHPGCGGTAVFLGTVRDDDAGRRVVGLDYEAHPDAAAVLAATAEQVAGRHRACRRLAVVHRAGALAVGDVAVVAAAAAPHRAEAFAAAQDLVDTVKAAVPVWKCSRFADGTSEWVGSA